MICAHTRASKVSAEAKIPLGQVRWSVDPTAARCCDDSENGVPVKLVSLALKGGFLKSIHSCWNRGKTQSLLNGLFCDGDLLLPDINRLQGRYVEVGVELNYPRKIDLPWLSP